MANARMPEEFYQELEPLLPPEQPVGPKGGRPRIEHRVVAKVIWFVLTTGCRWEDVPLDMGCSGPTAHRRLQAWQEMGVRNRLHIHLLKLLRRAGELEHETAIVDGVLVRAFGGFEATAPSPVGRRKCGSKHTGMVDRNGIPLAIRTAAANASDHTQVLPSVLDFPRVGGKPDRPKELPDEVYADRGYDNDATRATGWVSSRSSHVVTRNMAVAWERYTGWSSEPLVG